jgi:hypothetical protein
MPVEPWPTVIVGGTEYWEIPTLTRIAKADPDAQVFFLVGTPDGGVAAVGPLVKGDPGKHTEFQTAVDFTSLAWDDPTPSSAGVTVITPGSDTVSQVVQLALALHEGQPGADGTTSLDLDSIGGTAAAGKTVVVNATADGFDYQSIKVGDRYYPATVNSTPSGNPAYTLCPIAVPAHDFDWRPEVRGGAIVVGTGADVTVDLVARLQVGAVSAETSGNIIGRALGIAGQNPPPHVFQAAVTAADITAGGTDYDKVPAGQSAIIYIRAERQSGTETFTTQASRTTASVKVAPIP